MAYLNLLIIGFLCVFVIDYSGFVGEMEALINRWLKSPIYYHIPKPFSCSLCCTFWLGLIYLIVVGRLSFVALLVLCAVCCITPEIQSIIYFVKDLINKVFDTIEHFLGIEE